MKISAAEEKELVANTTKGQDFYLSPFYIQSLPNAGILSDSRNQNFCPAGSPLLALWVSRDPGMPQGVRIRNCYRVYMSTRTTHDSEASLFYITFTCYQWLPLFQLCNGYDCVYKWFDYLKDKYNIKTTAYTIMPKGFIASFSFR
jgi:hypothetical protein